MKREDLDRLSRLHESANDSARNFRTVYVSYLIIALYIFSIVIFREEELLFRNGSLQIAIVNFSVPIRSFFIVSPLILLALHFNLLIQAIFLSRKVHRYATAHRYAPAIQSIHSLQLRPSSNNEKMEMRDLLFPAPLAYMIAGRDFDRTEHNLLLVMVVVLPIMMMPPAILVITKIQFLKYQSECITIWQSILVIIDVVILWYLWPRITAPSQKWIQWFQLLSLANIVFMTLLMALLMIFIFMSTNLYDVREFLNQIKPAMSGPHVMRIANHDDSGRADIDNRKHTSLISAWIRNTKYEFQDRELVQERPPPGILSAYLDACGEKGCDKTVIDPGSPVWCKYAQPLELKERVFRDAELASAILCAVNFDNTIFNYADLSEAKLHSAKFINAKFHSAFLDGAELHGTDLSGAELHGAFLDGAELHGALLARAELHGAYLARAEFHGALLARAKLHGAYLAGAELHGADLRNADLRGAILRKTKFYGADLTNADLRGADLRGAKFYGAVLAGTNFSHTDLRITDVSEPDFPELYKQLKKTITDMNILNKIQDRIANAKNNGASVDPLSTKRHYIILGNKYRKKLATYLIDDLACKDKSSGYVAKGIARRALDDGMLGPQLAKNLLKAKCPAVANMLPEQLRADLEKMTDG